MDTCKVVQLIETTISRRGEGTVVDPIRVIREYWTFEGEKVAEIDPAFQEENGRIKK